MLSSTLPVRFALDFLGVDEFHEGDVFVANDPYHGGGHLPDYNVFAPVFADDAQGSGAWCSSPRSSATTATPAARAPGGYNVDAPRHLGRGRALAGGQGRSTAATSAATSST